MKWLMTLFDAHHRGEHRESELTDLSVAAGSQLDARLSSAE